MSQPVPDREKRASSSGWTCLNEGGEDSKSQPSSMMDRGECWWLFRGLGLESGKTLSISFRLRGSVKEAMDRDPCSCIAEPSASHNNSEYPPCLLSGCLLASAQSITGSDTQLARDCSGQP